MSKRLEDTEALSTRAMKKLSDKQRIIQEQANLIKEKEKSAEMFDEKERSHADMAKESDTCYFT